MIRSTASSALPRSVTNKGTSLPLPKLLIELGRFEEAEELLLESFSRVRDGEVRHPVLSRETLTRIIDLYEAWGRPDAAAPYLDMEDHL